MQPVRPLRHHLLLLAAIGLLPLALLGAWGTGELVETRRLDAQRTALDLSRALSSAVESELLSTINALESLTASPSLETDDIPEFYQLARAAVHARPNWAGMSLADGEGHVLFRTRLPFGDGGGSPSEPRSLDATLRDGRPSVGVLTTGKSSTIAFPVRVPLLRNGKVVYVVTATVKPDRFLEVVKRQNVPQSWVISVFDSANQRVARSKDHEKTLGTPPSEGLLELLGNVANEGLGLTRSLEGDENYTGFTRVRSFGWAVAVGVPTHELTQAIQRSIITYGAGVLASLLACWGLALLLARRISDPINQVREQAILLGEGAPVGMRPTGIREVDEMAAALATAAKHRAETTQERDKLLGSLREALAAAEEAGRAKDGFMAMLGHELRNPLAPIVNSLHLMEIKGDRATEAERRIIGRQVEHMKRLVDDLLDMSRITRGQLEIRDEPVDLRTVIERSIEAVRPLLAARSAPWRADVPAEALYVRGDEGRLVQVVVNLLTNALRFDPEGEIVVTLRALENNAEIVVRDHGAGMSPDVLAQAFEPFYQAPQSLARAVGGLGLGLAIVRSIVELHGGRVTADSRGPDRGSEFTVQLPRAAGPATHPDAQAATPAPASEGRVLVVDDNVDAAETTAMLLDLAGFDVRTAHNGRDALQAVAAFRPEVAVLDIGLPDIDGYELARRIRASGAGCELVALTGYGQASDRESSAQAGFALHLAKPADAALLTDAVHTLAKQSRLRMEAGSRQGH